MNHLPMTHKQRHTASRVISPQMYFHPHDPSREKGICPDLPGAVDTEVPPHVRRGSEVQLLDGTTRRLHFPQQIGMTRVVIFSINFYQSGYGYFNS